MKARKGSSTELILLALEKSIDGFVRFLDFAYNPRGYAYGGRDGYPLKKTSMAIALKRMREKGLVEFEEDETNQIVVKLTNLGKDALGELASIDDNWDGVWRMVIFDIPESKRGVRDQLRRRLKDWGFNFLQKSVCFGKANVTQKLRELIRRLGIEEWVVVIESNDSTLNTLLTRSLQQ